MNTEARQDDNYHLRRLVDRLPSMLAYWDKGLICRYANQAYKRWFGITPEHLIGTSIVDLLGPDLYALNKPYIDAALRGEEQTFERLIPGPGGTKRFAMAWYIPDVVDGVVEGFMVQVTELTQLRETEDALHRERTLRLQIEEHARKLDALLHERGEMLDVLAHEVRQPLNNASAALQSAATVLSEVGESVASVRLTRAQTVIGQVQSSIDNRLAVASLLGRSDPIERVDTDIDTLVSVAIADIPGGERERIRVERITSTRTASMDMSLMRMALRNLLNNALKYSPDNSPVTVRLTDSDDPLALLIDVVDAGPGMEPELVPHIFERGVRGKRQPGQPGHGLGLYIVQRVMALHGGRAELVRNGPQGATMRLWLTPAAYA